MKVINVIGRIIDVVVIFIQLPYIFIAGCIMGGSYIPHFGSNNVYVWYPTIGVITLWMRPYGDIAYDFITYKELFH